MWSRDLIKEAENYARSATDGVRIGLWLTRGFDDGLWILGVWFKCNTLTLRGGSCTFSMAADERGLAVQSHRGRFNHHMLEEQFLFNAEVLAGITRIIHLLRRPCNPALTARRAGSSSCSA